MKTLKTHATDVGMAALAFIAGDDDLRQAFLHWSGLTGETIAARAREPEFQGFVLDFILQSDDTVIDLARALGFPPEMIATARAALPGGDVPHWT